MRSTRLATAAVAAAALVTLAACSSDSGEDAGDAATDGAEGASSEVALISEGELTVCTNTPYEPFEYEEDGEIIGFDISIMDEVATDLGVEVAALNTGFDGIQSGAALEADTCDAVISAITITEEREENLDFSDPYFDADQAVMVQADSDIASMDDLSEATIGVMQATTGADWVTDQGYVGTEFEDLGLQVQALRNGQVDAIVNDIASLAAYADDEVVVLDTIATGEQYGIGVKQGNTALLDAINATLERIQGDGTYDAVYAEFIGTEAGEHDHRPVGRGQYREVLAAATRPHLPRGAVHRAARPAGGGPGLGRLVTRG